MRGSRLGTRLLLSVVRMKKHQTETGTMTPPGIVSPFITVPRNTTYLWLGQWLCFSVGRLHHADESGIQYNWDFISLLTGSHVQTRKGCWLLFTEEHCNECSAFQYGPFFSQVTIEKRYCFMCFLNSVLNGIMKICIDNTCLLLGVVVRG